MNHLPDAHPPGDGPPPVLPANLKLAPDSADFGSVVIGQSSAAMTFTVANIGEGESGSISAAISGGQGSNFAIDSTTCTTLAKAATCTVSVKFTPGSAGTKAASLAITATPGGTVMASIQGIGNPPGQLTITPSSNQFPNVVVGATAPATTTFTVKNTGAATTGTLTTTAGGSNAGEFNKVSDTCNGQTLAAAATCTIVVGFSPATSGPKFASFSVSSAPGGTVSAAVNGLAVDNAQLFLNPTAQSFGSVVTGSVSSDVTFTLVNIGGVASGAVAQSLTGTGAASFSIVSSSCQGATLNPGASCTVVAHFAPTAAGAVSATLGFTGTPGGAKSADLTGTGVVPGSILIAPSLKTFANTTVGQTSAPQDFVVTNTGGSTTGAINTSLSGLDNTQFRVTANGCLGVTLAPNATCTITATFAPGSPGAKQAQLAAAASPGGSTSAALSGNGIPSAALSITPSSHDFGSVGVGDTTGVQAFVIQNVGGASTGIPTASLTGANPNQFVMTSSCPTALAPLQTCTVSVRFAPTTIGSDVATLDVTASPGNTVSANLFGEGVDPAALTVNPSSITFAGITTIGDISTQSSSFVVTNNGASATGPLTVALAGTNPGDFVIANNTCINQKLAGGATCTVFVRFAPTARGARAASVKVSGTPGGSVSVALAGSALPRLEITQINGSPTFTNPFDYGTVTVKTTRPDLHQISILVQNNTNASHTLDVAGIDLTTFTHPGTGDFNEFTASCGGVDFTSPHKPVKFAITPALTIAAHNTCLVTFRFIPLSAGAKTGQVVFSIGSSQLDQAIENLKGVGQDGMYWTFTAGGTPATQFDFGNVALGGSSPFQTVLLYNRVDAPTTGPITLNALAFAQFGGFTNCFDQGKGGPPIYDVTLAANTSCFVDLEFFPSILGPDHAILNASADPGGAPTFDFHGTGVDSAGLIINPIPVDFQSVIKGLHKVVTVTVQNPAGAQTTGPFSFNLQNDSCGGQGSGSGQMFPCFKILSDQPATDCQSGNPITNGTSCQIRIEFDTENQSGFGFANAQLSVSASPGISSSPLLIKVFGNAQSEISITPTDGAFGTVQAGSPVSRTYTVRNDSAATVTLSDVLFFPFSGSLKDLSLADACSGAVLPAGAGCDVTVTFAPLSDQTIDANLSYTSTNGFAGVELTGVGQAPGVFFETKEIDFFTAPSTQTVFVFNEGNGAASIGQLTLTGDTSRFLLSNDTCSNTTLASQGECQVDVQVAGGPCFGISSVTVTAPVPNNTDNASVEAIDFSCD